jgi:hypothetical protein
MNTRFAALAGLALIANTDPATSAEGGSSNYFPGTYGLILPAVAPEAGSSFTSMNLFYRATGTRSVSEGSLNLGIEVRSAVTAAQYIHAWTLPSGGTFVMGVIAPYALADYDSTVVPSVGPALQRTGSGDGLGDMSFIPASYYWSSGQFNFNVYGVIIAPTGKYDVNNDVNIGRNYWGLDTVFAMTWFNEASGTEISVIPGLMFNGENKATSYRTGTEFHVDFLLNQFVTNDLAIGLRGYAYAQISGDSGTGAILGDFKGSSWGIGPTINYIPASMGGDFVFGASYVADISATNRLKAGYGVVNLTWLF